MRRTAALLTLPAFLSLVLLERDDAEVMPGDSVRLLIDGIPILLVLVSCIGSASPAQPVLQAVGSLWLLALWGRLHLASEARMVTAATSLIFLGTTALSFLEVGIGSRKKPDPDPERRLLILLLLLIGVGPLVLLGEYLSHYGPSAFWDGTPADLVEWIGIPLGVSALFLLSAWGIWKRQSWATWIGAGASGFYLLSNLWKLLKAFQYHVNPGVPTRFLIRDAPLLMILAVLVGLLLCRIRRERKPPTPAAA